MRAVDHAGAGSLAGEKGAKRKAAADALGDRHDVGGARHNAHRRTAYPFVRRRIAPSSKTSSNPGRVAERAQAVQKIRCRDPNAALALDRLDEDRAGLWADGGLDGREIAERHAGEALDLGAEALDIFGVSTGGDGRQRAARVKAPSKVTISQRWGAP